MCLEGEVLTQGGLVHLMAYVDDSGLVYVAEYGNHRVQVFGLALL